MFDFAQGCYVFLRCTNLISLNSPPITQIIEYFSAEFRRKESESGKFRAQIGFSSFHSILLWWTSMALYNDVRWNWNDVLPAISCVGFQFCLLCFKMFKEYYNNWPCLTGVAVSIGSMMIFINWIYSNQHYIFSL